MEEQQSKQAAENVVQGIKQGFTVVGNHRVHSWYAWAIVGIMFGMALGVTYVANRSGDFVQSEAAGNKFTITGPIEANSRLLSTWLYKNGGFISDDLQSGKTVSLSGSYTLPDPSMTTAGAYFNQGGPAAGRAVGAVLYSKNSGNIYASTGSSIDTTKPIGKASAVYEHTLSAVYVRKSGEELPVQIGGSVYLATDVEGGARFQYIGTTGQSPVYGATGNIKIAGGLPFYVTPGYPIVFKNVPKPGHPNADSTFRLKRYVSPVIPYAANIKFRIAPVDYNDMTKGYKVKSIVIAPKVSTSGTPITDDSTDSDPPLADDEVVSVPLDNTTTTTSTQR